MPVVLTHDADHLPTGLYPEPLRSGQGPALFLDAFLTVAGYPQNTPWDSGPGDEWTGRKPTGPDG